MSNWPIPREDSLGLAESWMLGQAALESLALESFDADSSEGGMTVIADITFSGTGTGLGTGFAPCTFLSDPAGWNRSSGLAVPNDYNNDCGEAYTSMSAVADQWVTLTYENPQNCTSGSGQGVYVRLPSTSSEGGYSIMVDLDTYAIARFSPSYTSLVVAGLTATLGGSAVNLVDGDRLCFAITGTGATVTINLYWGADPTTGTLFATYADTDASRVTTAGIACIAQYSVVPATMGVSRMVIGDFSSGAVFMPGSGGSAIPNMTVSM